MSVNRPWRLVAALAAMLLAALLALPVALTPGPRDRLTAALGERFDSEVEFAAQTNESQHADPARTFLRQTFNLSRDDMGRVDNGRAIARSLAADDKREVASVGIVRIAVTPDVFVRRLEDIASFKKADAVLQIGTFSNPPATSDVETLTLDSADIRNLRQCRIDNCDLQLPPAVIERLRRDVDWNSDTHAARANQIIRNALIDYVAEYRRSGADSVMVYADESRHVNVSSEFRDLITSDARVLPRFADLRWHLLVPIAAEAGTTDLIYWSKERVARKSVISVTHLAIARQSSTSPAAYVAASKQLYASHYFESSLGLTIVLPVRSTSGTASYVVYTNRSRVDAFRGLFGGITRGIVRSRARGALASYLEDLKARLERVAGLQRIPADQSFAQTSAGRSQPSGQARGARGHRHPMSTQLLKECADLGGPLR